MLSVLAAAALAVAPVPPAAVDDPDLRCYAATALAVAGLQKSGQMDPKALIGLTAVLWYYYGRMESRTPDLDFAAAIAQLLAKPGYVSGGLQADAQRCGAEAEAKGKKMEEMGKRLQELAPQLDHRAS